jgi:hypothetical protein
MISLLLTAVRAIPQEVMNSCTANNGYCFSPSEGTCNGKAVLNGLCGNMMKCCADIPELVDAADNKGLCRAERGSCSLSKAEGFCVSGTALNDKCSGGASCCSRKLDYVGYVDKDEVNAMCSVNNGLCLFEDDFHDDMVPLAGLCTNSKTCYVPKVDDQILELHYSVPSQVRLFPEYKGVPLLDVVLKAMIYLDKRKIGTKMPLIVLAHGNHKAGEKSYLGYGYLGAHLARRGFSVISIDFDDTKISGNDKFPYLRDPVARANLMLEHLKSIKQIIRVIDGIDVTESIDFSNIGLLGHSRGGEAVKKLYQTLESNHRSKRLLEFQVLNSNKVKGVFQLANTDSNIAESSGAEYDIPWTGLVPACDGDVFTFQAVQTFQRLRRIGAEFRRNLITVVGANHNYFNTRWVESDYTYNNIVAGRCASFLGQVSSKSIPPQVSFMQQDSLKRYAYDFFEKLFAGQDPELVSLSTKSFRAFVETYSTNSLEIFNGVNLAQIKTNNVTLKNVQFFSIKDPKTEYDKRQIAQITQSGLLAVWYTPNSYIDILVDKSGPFKVIEIEIGYREICFGNCSTIQIETWLVTKADSNAKYLETSKLMNDEVEQIGLSSAITFLRKPLLLQTLKIALPVNDLSEISSLRIVLPECKSIVFGCSIFISQARALQ